MADPLPENEANDRMPRWVKLSGAIVILLALVIAGMVLSGHGPGQHGGDPDATENGR